MSLDLGQQLGGKKDISLTLITFCESGQIPMCTDQKYKRNIKSNQMLFVTWAEYNSEMLTSP
jgi:hypothetical protein